MNDPYFSTGEEGLDEFQTSDLLRRELDKDEKLLWSGRPRSGFGGPAVWFPFFMGIPFTLFSIFWIAAASGMGSGGPAGEMGIRFVSIFALFGVPFVLVGLGMLSTPIWAAKRRKQTRYAVTNKRALIIQPGFMGRSMMVTSVRPDEMREVGKVIRPDGSGDLIFSPISPTYTAVNQQIPRVCFVGIENVNEVERLIREQLMNPARAQREG